MLRLIILGEIPGTTVQITFLQVMLTLMVFLMVLLTAHELHNNAKKAPQPTRRKKATA